MGVVLYRIKELFEKRRSAGRRSRAAAEMIDQAGTPEGFLIGITEDMPPDRWRDSCRAIMDGIDRHAQANPHLYAPGVHHPNGSRRAGC